MKTDIINAINELEKQKGISKDSLLSAVEAAMVSAYKRAYGINANVRVTIDSETGEIQLFSVRRVVEVVDPENKNIEISLEAAREINSKYQEGDYAEEEIFPKDFGRIAATAAKQIIVQRIREAERGIIFDEYSEKENEAVTAIVSHIEKNGVIVELGKTEGIIPTNEMMPNESYTKNKRIKVYLMEVRKTNKNPQILVSRTHSGLVKRLFEMEVPEIQSGVVHIKAVARDAGSRSKIAVTSNNPQVDPVGACVGQRGIRVENIVSELNNEKIDIIEWDSDPVVFIAKALSPAKVKLVYINETEKAARVVVADDQLSLAIGKGGQNAYLAAKLTGWKIDIKKSSEAEEMDLSAPNMQPREETTFEDLKRAFEENQ
ncbi:MAG: transcription termination/antitermination protein NusA [Clostridiales bacterium]|nr:transcription termination/antitermination protein NusA [Clostridiales bacterium]